MAKKVSKVETAKEKAPKVKGGLSFGAPKKQYLKLTDRNWGAMFKVILGCDGFPKGTLIEFFGPPGVGKTATLQKIGGMVQKDGGKYGHVDVENAFNEKFARQNCGVDTDSIVMASETPAHGEAAFEIACDMMKEHKLDVVVFDSIAAARPRGEIEEGKLQIGAHALMCSREFPRLAMAAQAGQSVLFMVNQVRNKIGVMFGDPETTTGGNAPDFYESIRVKVTKKGSIKGENGEEVGFVVGYKPTKNRYGYLRGQFDVVMSRGFIPNVTQTALSWAKDYDLLDSENNTIAGIPVVGSMSRIKNQEDAIKGKEYIIFDKIHALLEEQEANSAKEFDKDTDISAQDDDWGSDEAEVKLSADEVLALKEQSEEEVELAPSKVKAAKKAVKEEPATKAKKK